MYSTDTQTTHSFSRQLRLQISSCKSGYNPFRSYSFPLLLLCSNSSAEENLRPLCLRFGHYQLVKHLKNLISWDAEHSTAAGNGLKLLQTFWYLSRHLKGLGNMSSVQFLDTTTEVTERGIINSKGSVFKIKSSSTPLKQQQRSVLSSGTSMRTSWALPQMSPGRSQDA